MHGGAAPQVQRKRLERVALAEALAADPARPPAEVLLDVAHTYDWLFRKAREEVDSHRPTAATMSKLLEAAEANGRWAKTTLDAATDDRHIRLLEQQTRLLFQVVTEAVAEVVPGDEPRKRVLALISAGLREQKTIDAGRS